MDDTVRQAGIATASERRAVEPSGAEDLITADPLCGIITYLAGHGMHGMVECLTAVELEMHELRADKRRLDKSLEVCRDPDLAVSVSMIAARLAGDLRSGEMVGSAETHWNRRLEACQAYLRLYKYGPKVSGAAIAATTEGQGNGE